MGGVPELLMELPVADRLGECITWDDRTGCFLWTDIPARRLHRYCLETNELHTIPLAARLCSFALSQDPRFLFSAFESEIGWLEIATGRFWKVAGIALPGGVRLNDGRAGPDGSFWVGSMVGTAADAGGTGAGILYKVSPQGGLLPLMHGICISNGLAWSPDGQTLYHSDSRQARITAYQFDPELGVIGPVVATSSVEEGEPDGAAVDASGRYLSALWGQGTVAAFRAGLSLEGFIEVPASQPTCIAFGGVGLDLLAVTTAREGLSDDALAQDPKAGSLFIYRVPFTGAPQFRFAGTPPCP